MPIRLLACDLDNTLLSPDREIDPENVAAIHRAVEAGIQVVLASGRIQTSIRIFAEQLGLTGPLIACNGSDGVYVGGQPIFHRRLDPRAVRAILSYCAAMGVQANAYTATQVFFVTESSWAEEYESRVRSVRPGSIDLESACSLDVSKVLVIDDAERIPEHRSAISNLIKGIPVRWTESEPEYLEFLPDGVSKGTALATVAEHLGIAQVETAAIGDYLNDLEMIEWAGIGAAVANAHPEVAAVANKHVSSHDHHGVAEFIDFLLSQR